MYSYPNEMKQASLNEKKKYILQCELIGPFCLLERLHVKDIWYPSNEKFRQLFDLSIWLIHLIC